MEKAILRTLIYADIFGYPLKTEEFHKWLIGKKATLRQVERASGRLNHELRIMNQGDYYFLPKRHGLINKRVRKEKQSAKYFKKAKVLTQILKIIPWIKLVGVSGGLALNNAGKKDDIDLFLITGKNRLWISRFLALGLLSLTGQRRKVGEKGRQIAGKLCLNILLEEDKLEQKNKDIFVAHEVLQMKVLWQRDGIYSKYLADNEWVFKFLPNWIASDTSLRGVIAMKQSSTKRVDCHAPSGLAMTGIENFAKWLQLKIMSKPRGMERIEEGALYFHPEDCRLKILEQYKKKLATP